jgi:hypothetical protein
MDFRTSLGVLGFVSRDAVLSLGESCVSPDNGKARKKHVSKATIWFGFMA